MFGLTVEEATPDIELWPDNVDSFIVFQSLSTQWRVGMNGATGLDYGVIPAVQKMLKIDTDVFEDIQIMECAVLNMWASKK